MAEPSDVDGQASFASAYPEDAEPGSSGVSPSRQNHNLDAIEHDPGASRIEEGSNTVNESEQPDVISSYTEQEGTAEPNAYINGQGDEEGPADDQGAEQGPGDAYEGGDGEGEGEDGEHAGGYSEQQGGSGEEPRAEQQEYEQLDQQDPSYTQDGYTQEDQPEEGYQGGYQEGAGPDTADAGVDAYQERPASTGADQPAASTSRPGSGAAQRPGSGRPTSARPTSARPGSAVQRGSRPASGSQNGHQVEGLQTEGDPYAAEAGAGGGLGGEYARPGTSQGGARPGSSSSAGGYMDGGLGRGGLEGVPFTIPEEHSLGEQPAMIERYIATGLKAIDVEVDVGPGLPHRMLRVLLDYTQQDRKPYLGGYRNKRTGAVYHHAGSQTPRAPKYSEADRKLSRETQTVKQKKHSQQTVREQATQMERPGVLLDTTYDKVVTPGRYQTADEREAIVLGATRCIQRWVRGWLGRKRASYLRAKKREREAFLREQELAAQREAEEHRRKEIQRRMHPRTAADFEVLYNELEAWRLQETRRIKEAGLPKEQEQQVLQQLLHKETKLLQTIDRLKINANQENKEARIQHTLNEMSKPKKFALRNGGKVDVHTPFTTRAKELQQLYNGLNLPLLTVDERLDVLLHVKWTVKEFDCDLTREIVELIDREADLLNRGRNPKVLEGLRKRISSLFLNFIETPEFNPEAVRFQIVPMDFETYLYEQVGKATAKAGTTIGTRRAVEA